MDRPHRARATVSLLLLLACAPARPLESHAGSPSPTADRPPPRQDPALAIAALEAQRSAGVPGLARLLQRPDRPLRRLALQALGRIGDPSAIASITPHLADPDPEIAAAAAHALGLADAPVDLQALAPLLAHPDPAPRVAALDALGRGGRAPSIPAIVEALGDLDDAVAAAAALALGRLGRRSIALDDAAVAGLIHEAWAPDRRRRAAAVHALARAHEPEAQPAAADALRARLADEDPEIRAEAALGCARWGLGGDPALVAALADPAWMVRLAAARALAAPSSPPAAREALADALAQMAYHVLLDINDETWTNIHVLEDSMKILRASAGEARVQALASEIMVASEELLPQRRPPLAASRLHCAAAALAARAAGDLAPLARCGGAREQGMAPHLRDGLLIEALGDGLGDGLAGLDPFTRADDPRVRAAAIAAVAARLTAADADADARATAAALLIAALGDPAGAVVGAAAEGLTRAAQSPALRPLVAGAAAPAQGRARAAHAAGDHELTQALLGLVGAAGSEAALPLCRTIAGDRHPALRAAALACVDALHGRPPEEDPEAPPIAPPPPPFDPGAVLGQALTWQVATTRGTILIDLEPAAAPQSVAALVALSDRGFYDGLPWHRVVPGFVIQGGDPEGTGWGGPGFSLPAEASWRPFERGAVGIADAGKDTGGSQWFIMHARAPHLEGRYTRIGQVVDGMAIVDAITDDDRILHARVVRSR